MDLSMANQVQRDSVFAALELRNQVMLVSLIWRNASLANRTNHFGGRGKPGLCTISRFFTHL